MRSKTSNIWWLVLSTYIILSAFGCGGGGGGGGPAQPITGPGDTGNYFPFAEGNTWITKVTASETGASTVNFFNTTMVTGTKVVDGATTTVLVETNPDNSGIAEEGYVVKDSNGIIVYGNNDPGDTLTPQLSPYTVVKFPLTSGSSFAQIDKKGLDFGEDLDGDGVNETVDVYSTVTIAGFETVTVQAGTFQNSVRREWSGTLTVTSSYDGEKITVTESDTQWYAPGVGFVKGILTVAYTGYSRAETEELIGYIVDGQSAGITSLTVGMPQGDSVVRDGAKVYMVTVTPSGLYTASITGLSDNANLHMFNSLSVQGCYTNSADSKLPKDCTLTASGVTLYMIVDGFFVAAPTSTYTIMVAPSPVIPNPVNEFSQISRGIPTVGTVKRFV